jgi:hypothetical protein
LTQLEERRGKKASWGGSVTKKRRTLAFGGWH